MNGSNSLSVCLDVAEFCDWGQMFDECCPRIVVWCREFGLQAADADDISQDVVVKAFRFLRSGKYDPACVHFLSWLRAVTANTVRTFLKTRDSRLEVPISESSHDSSLTRNSQTGRCSNDEKSERDQQLKLLRRAECAIQQRVKSKTWEAYRRTIHEQLPASRAAERVGMTVQEVYVAKCRVIGYLRTQYNQRSDRH